MGGGAVASRGLYMQILVSTLYMLQKSTDETGYDFVKIEPDTKDDKVDLMFELKGMKEVFQIKTSKNIVNPKSYLKVLSDMVYDEKDASKYISAYCLDINSHTILELHNRINKGIYPEQPFEREISSDELKKMECRLEENDIEKLIQRIGFFLVKFLHQKDKEISNIDRIGEIIELLYHPILNNGFSEKKLSRQEFEDKILTLIEGEITESVNFQKEERERKLILKLKEFYVKNICEILDLKSTRSIKNNDEFVKQKKEYEKELIVLREEFISIDDSSNRFYKEKENIDFLIKIIKKYLKNQNDIESKYALFLEFLESSFSEELEQIGIELRQIWARFADLRIQMMALGKIEEDSKFINQRIKSKMTNPDKN